MKSIQCLLIALLTGLCVCLSSAQVLTGIIDREESDNTSPTTKSAKKTKIVSPLEKSLIIKSNHGSLTIMRVWPDKVFYKPNEKAMVDIELRNTTNEPQSVSLLCQAVQEMNDTSTLFSQDISLPAQKTINVKQQFPLRDLWGGVELRATLIQNKKILSNASEYFAVGENPLAFGQYLVVGTTRGRAKEYKKKIIPEIRDNYINCIEWFSWSPDTFGCFVPKNKHWRSTQCKYPEGMDGAKSMIDSAHSNGISVMAYVKQNSNGPIGFDIARRNPELVLYNVWGHFAGDGMGTRDTVEELAYISPGLKEIAVVEYNFADIRSVKLGTQAWLEGVDVFGYDGVRFDGHYLATGPGASCGYVFDVNGKDPNGGVSHAVLSERNMKLMKSITQKRRPGFLFGFNYGFSYDKAGAYAPKAFSVAAEDSMIMWENAQGWARTGKSWDDYVRNFKKEANIVIANKGHLFGIVIEGSPVFNGYAAALAIASRGHISSMKNMRPWYRFATRNADFIYDPKIKEVSDPQDTVQVHSKGKIIYKPFVYKRNLSQDHVQYITHLVNVPSDVIDKKAQYFPAPLSDVQFAYKIKPSQKVNKVYWTQAGEPQEKWVELPWRQVGNQINIKLPSLNLWGIVLIDCDKKN